ncbi:hypothetical protein IAT38_003111 [Cryptococcus sp. DSM 104549]
MPSLAKTYLSPLLRTLALPLFALLHVLFTLLSLLLRTYQALTTPLAEADTPLNAPPKHIGLVLVPTVQAKGKGGRWRTERERLVESLKEVVGWAAERGVQEVSVWDGQGLTQSALPSLLRTLSSPTLPPSPPTSPPLPPTQDTDPFSDTYAPASESHSSPSHSITPISPISDSPRRIETKLGSSVTSLTVRPNTSGQEVTVHFLPPSSASPTIASLARGYASGQVAVQDIDVKRVDEDVKEHLHFINYPDLLIVHHLSPPSVWTSLLPRRAPELWGYPFWALRITEIYQPPTPIPLLQRLNPLIRALRSSSLPFIRKVGYGLSVPPSPAQGVMSKEEWDGAMRAWLKVEQRLGR